MKTRHETKLDALLALEEYARAYCSATGKSDAPYTITPERDGTFALETPDA